MSSPIKGLDTWAKVLLAVAGAIFAAGSGAGVVSTRYKAQAERFDIQAGQIGMNMSTIRVNTVAIAELRRGQDVILTALAMNTCEQRANRGGAGSLQTCVTGVRREILTLQGGLP